MQKIEFYFDFLSPFSYFAWKNHKEKLSEHELTFSYKPVLMGKLFSHFEFPGPGEIKVKRDYELKKCFRYAGREGITFVPPKTFPFNPLAIIRLATMAAANEKQEQIIDLIFDLVWGKGMVLEDPELIGDLLTKASFSPEILERSFTPPAKQELKSNIKDAIAKNIFGVPTLALDQKEFFWGNDSLSDLNRYLSGNDNWDREYYNSLVE